MKKMESEVVEQSPESKEIVKNDEAKQVYKQRSHVNLLAPSQLNVLPEGLKSQIHLTDKSNLDDLLTLIEEPSKSSGQTHPSVVQPERSAAAAQLNEQSMSTWKAQDEEDQSQIREDDQS